MLNFAQVSKIEIVDDGYLYFYGTPCPSEEGGSDVPVIAIFKYESEKSAELVLGGIIADCELSKTVSYLPDAIADID